MATFAPSMKKTNVATPSSAYQTMKEAWEIPEVLVGGTPLLKKDPQKWLPPYERESNTAYNQRKARSVLFSAYERSLQTYAGLPFSSSVMVTKVPDELAYLSEDTDNMGTSLTSFGYDLLYEAIHLGVTHFLVEYPYFSEENAPSLADVEEYKIRPYLVPISPKSLIAWKVTNVGGYQKTTEIRLSSSEIVPDGQWGEKVVESIRVTSPDTISICTADDDGNYPDDPTEMWANPLSYIPLISVYGDKTGHLQGKPTLSGLAEQNLLHYRKLSDVDNIERMVCSQFLFGSAMEQAEMDGVSIGPNMVITASNDKANLRYIGPDATGIAANQNSVDKIEKRMIALGGDLILKQAADRVTATARMIDKSESISILQVIINRLAVAIEKAYNIAADYIGIEQPNVQVNIGNNLNTSDGVNLVDILAQYLLDNDGMDITQASEELRRRGHLIDTYDVKDTVPTNKDNQTGETPNGDNNDNVNTDDTNNEQP